jgi:DNA-binding MarR family transcriptional regulator
MSRSTAGAKNALGIPETTALANELIWLTNRLSARAIIAFRPLGVSAIGARIIAVLEKEASVRAAGLSADIDIDPAATSRALKGLKAQGLVYADEDRRLGLTDSGARLREDVAVLSEDLYRGLTTGFSSGERRELLTYLMRMRQNLPALSALGRHLEHFSERSR